MAIAETKDIVTEGDLRLTSQFKDSDELHVLLQTYLQEIQELEDSFSELQDERSLETAIGDQLEDIGIYVGEPRNGKTDDEEYRSAIKLRIAVNNSEGTPNEILSILKDVTSAVNVTINESSGTSGSLSLTTDGPFAGIPSDLVPFMQKTLCAGVRLDSIAFMPDNVFIPDPDITTSLGNTSKLAELTSPIPAEKLFGVMSELID